MRVPLSEVYTVVSYLLKQKWAGRERFPLVLMLEPLYRCNLACAGCGKIQYPSNVLKSQLSVEECMRAVDACPTPVVSIPGGEPLLHPQIDQIVAGLVARRRYVYLCTNALLLEEKLSLFEPSRYLTFSVHLDGPEQEHDAAVCRDALVAAAELRAAFPVFNAARERAGKPVMEFGLALHLGEVFYGNIGASDRLDFTVIGPAVNEASRIQALCRSLDRNVLVSSTFRAAAGSEPGLESLGFHTLRGVREPQELFGLAS